MAGEEKLTVPSDDFFAAVKYHVIGSLQDQVSHSENLPGKSTHFEIPFQTEELLQQGGATKKNYPVPDVSHFLAGSDAESEALQEVCEIYDDVPLVKGDDWVISSVKCGSKLPSSCFEAAPSKGSIGHLFKGLKFSLSGIRDPKDVCKLWALIRTRGGQFSRELKSNWTTHLICASKLGAKYEKAFALRSGKIKIVTPDYVTECVRNKTLLPEDTFHPRLMIQPGEVVETPRARKVKKKRAQPIVPPPPEPAQVTPAPVPVTNPNPVTSVNAPTAVSSAPAPTAASGAAPPVSQPPSGAPTPASGAPKPVSGVPMPVSSAPTPTSGVPPMPPVSQVPPKSQAVTTVVTMSQQQQMPPNVSQLQQQQMTPGPQRPQGPVQGPPHQMVQQNQQNFPPNMPQNPNQRMMMVSQQSQQMPSQMPPQMRPVMSQAQQMPHMSQQNAMMSQHNAPSMVQTPPQQSQYQMQQQVSSQQQQYGANPMTSMSQSMMSQQSSYANTMVSQGQPIMSHQVIV